MFYILLFWLLEDWFGGFLGNEIEKTCFWVGVFLRRSLVSGCFEVAFPASQRRFWEVSHRETWENFQVKFRHFGSLRLKQTQISGWFQNPWTTQKYLTEFESDGPPQHKREINPPGNYIPYPTFVELENHALKRLACERDMLSVPTTYKVGPVVVICKWS